jgi:hypothetical protein
MYYFNGERRPCITPIDNGAFRVLFYGSKLGGELDDCNTCGLLDGCNASGLLASRRAKNFAACHALPRSVIPTVIGTIEDSTRLLAAWRGEQISGHGNRRCFYPGPSPSLELMF